MAQAGAEIGKAAARVNLPDLPLYCREHEEYAEVRPGDEAVTVIDRGRVKVDRGNARTDFCAGFYDGVGRGLK